MKSVTGVQQVGGDVQGTAQMVDPATDEPIGGFGPPTIGTNWNDVSSGTVSINQGDPPMGPDDVAIDAATAKKHDLAVGEKIQILFAQGDGRVHDLRPLVVRRRRQPRGRDARDLRHDDGSEGPG